MKLTPKPSKKIYLIGTIDESLYAEFTKTLAKCESEGDEAVLIELSSGGGIAYDALAFCGRIRTSPLDVHVVAHGLVASAAVLILAAGDKRSMSKESWVMVHEDSGRPKGDVTALEQTVSHLRRMENQWNSILAELTGQKAETWAKLHTNTNYLSAKECLRLGLIDGII